MSIDYDPASQLTLTFLDDDEDLNDIKDLTQHQQSQFSNIEFKSQINDQFTQTSQYQDQDLNRDDLVSISIVIN